MANSAQARKRIRQAEKHHSLNASQRSTARTYIKRVEKAIRQGDKAQAEQAFNIAQPIIDRMGRKRVLHPNTAARHKSRLARNIKAMA